MSTPAVHTETHGDYVIKIFYDQDGPNPRTDYEHLGTIYHTHRNYDLGEKMDLEAIQAIYDDPAYVCLPVFMYEHGNVMLKTSAFGCPWDSGQCGIIAVLKSKVLKEWNRKKWSKRLEEKVINCLKGEINEFSDYLNGNVYGYVIEKSNECEKCNHDEPIEVDSCWGFIGDYEYCLKEAISALPEEVKVA